jgi:hypothetical protein
VDGASATVGSRLSLIVRDAASAHWLQTPVITAATDWSSPNSATFFSERLLSERLSRTTSLISWFPAMPASFSCSTLSRRASW